MSGDSHRWRSMRTCRQSWALTRLVPRAATEPATPSRRMQIAAHCVMILVHAHDRGSSRGIAAPSADPGGRGRDHPDGLARRRAATASPAEHVGSERTTSSSRSRSAVACQAWVDPASNASPARRRGRFQCCSLTSTCCSPRSDRPPPPRSWWRLSRAGLPRRRTDRVQQRRPRQRRTAGDEPRVFVNRIRRTRCVTLSTPCSTNRGRLSPKDRHTGRASRHCVGNSQLRGNLVPDAHLAAIAIDQRAELITFDRGFARFPRLRWRCLLDD